MATNGIVLRYNPVFVDTLNAATLAGVLAHEVMHPALKHHTRRAKRDPGAGTRPATMRSTRCCSMPVSVCQTMCSSIHAFAG